MECRRQAIAPKCGPTPAHDDAIKQRLADLWETGLSTAKIGRHLGISKNAVVGLRTRMGLPARGSPIPQRGVAAVLAPQPIADVVVERYVYRPPPPALAPAPMPVARYADCQYPLNDGRPWAFCGEATQASSAYCREHHRICWNRPPRQAAGV